MSVTAWGYLALAALPVIVWTIEACRRLADGAGGPDGALGDRR